MSSSLRRIFLSLLSFVYFSTNVVCSHALETAFWTSRAQATAALSPQLSLPIVSKKESFDAISKSLQPASIETLISVIPPQFAHVRAVAMPAGKPRGVVIHFQDVHKNAEAQLNISRTLVELFRRNALQAVALEGAFKPLRLEPYRSLTHADARAAVADYLLAQNEISGAVHAALVSPRAVPPMFGIDDKPAYDANVSAFLSSRGIQEKLKKKNAADLAALTIEKEKSLNPQLLAFDRAVTAYQSGDLSLGKFAQTLNEALPNASGRESTFATFLEALEYESSLDFTLVERERSALLKNLSSKLSGASTNALIDAGVAYRLGQLSGVKFYERLSALCAKNGVGLTRFPVFMRYLRYLQLADSISGEKLMAEVETRQQTITARIINTENERALVERGRELLLTRKLLDFSLTKEEWGEYQRLSKEISPLQRREERDAFASFYEAANIRDGKMSENFLSKKLIGNAALITGGFHAAGIQKKLLASGIAVITVVPNLTKVNAASGSQYLSAFAREKTPLEKLFDGDKLFLADLPDRAMEKGLAPTAMVATEAYLHPLTGGQIRSLAHALAPSQASRGKIAVKRLAEAVQVTFYYGWHFVTVTVRFGSSAIQAITMSKVQTSFFRRAAIAFGFMLGFPGMLQAAEMAGEMNAPTSFNTVMGFMDVLIYLGIGAFQRDRSNPSRGWFTEVIGRPFGESLAHYHPGFRNSHPEKSWHQWIGIGMIWVGAVGGAALAMGGELQSLRDQQSLFWFWLGGWGGHAAYNQLARWFGWARLAKSPIDPMDETKKLVKRIEDLPNFSGDALNMEKPSLEKAIDEFANKNFASIPTIVLALARQVESSNESNLYWFADVLSQHIEAVSSSDMELYAQAKAVLIRRIPDLSPTHRNDIAKFLQDFSSIDWSKWPSEPSSQVIEATIATLEAPSDRIPDHFFRFVFSSVGFLFRKANPEQQTRLVESLFSKSAIWLLLFTNKGMDRNFTLRKTFGEFSQYIKDDKGDKTRIKTAEALIQFRVANEDNPFWKNWADNALGELFDLNDMSSRTELAVKLLSLKSDAVRLYAIRAIAEFFGNMDPAEREFMIAPLLRVIPELNTTAREEAFSIFADGEGLEITEHELRQLLDAATDPSDPERQEGSFLVLADCASKCGIQFVEDMGHLLDRGRYPMSIRSVATLISTGLLSEPERVRWSASKLFAALLPIRLIFLNFYLVDFVMTELQASKDSEARLRGFFELLGRIQISKNQSIKNKEFGEKNPTANIQPHDLERAAAYESLVELRQYNALIDPILAEIWGSLTMVLSFQTETFDYDEMAAFEAMVRADLLLDLHISPTEPFIIELGRMIDSPGELAEFGRYAWVLFQRNRSSRGFEQAESHALQSLMEASSRAEFNKLRLPLAYHMAAMTSVPRALSVLRDLLESRRTWHAPEIQAAVSSLVRDKPAAIGFDQRTEALEVFAALTGLYMDSLQESRVNFFRNFPDSRKILPLTNDAFQLQTAVLRYLYFLNGTFGNEITENIHEAFRNYADTLHAILVQASVPKNMGQLPEGDGSQRPWVHVDNRIGFHRLARELGYSSRLSENDRGLLRRAFDHLMSVKDMTKRFKDIPLPQTPKTPAVGMIPWVAALFPRWATHWTYRVFGAPGIEDGFFFALIPLITGLLLVHFNAAPWIQQVVYWFVTAGMGALFVYLHPNGRRTAPIFIKFFSAVVTAALVAGWGFTPLTFGLGFATHLTVHSLINLFTRTPRSKANFEKIIIDKQTLRGDAAQLIERLAPKTPNKETLIAQLVESASRNPPAAEMRQDARAINIQRWTNELKNKKIISADIAEAAQFLWEFETLARANKPLEAARSQRQRDILNSSFHPELARTLQPEKFIREALDVTSLASPSKPADWGNMAITVASRLGERNNGISTAWDFLRLLGQGKSLPDTLNSIITNRKQLALNHWHKLLTKTTPDEQNMIVRNNAAEMRSVRVAEVATSKSIADGKGPFIYGYVNSKGEIVAFGVPQTLSPVLTYQLQSGWLFKFGFHFSLTGTVKAEDLYLFETPAPLKPIIQRSIQLAENELVPGMIEIQLLAEQFIAAAKARTGGEEIDAVLGRIDALDIANTFGNAPFAASLKPEDMPRFAAYISARLNEEQVQGRISYQDAQHIAERASRWLGTEVRIEAMHIKLMLRAAEYDQAKEIISRFGGARKVVVLAEREIPGVKEVTVVPDLFEKENVNRVRLPALEKALSALAESEGPGSLQDSLLVASREVDLAGSHYRISKESPLAVIHYRALEDIFNLTLPVRLLTVGALVELARAIATNA